MGFWRMAAEHRGANRTAPKETTFEKRLRFHFGSDPATLPIVAESFGKHEQPNLNLAILDYLDRPGRSAEVVGVAGQGRFMGRSLSGLLSASEGFGGAPGEGPVEYINIPLDGGRMLACIERGLYLIAGGGQALAAYIRGAEEPGASASIKLEVMAADRAAAERFLAEIRDGAKARSVYRGRAISLEEKGYNDLTIKFHDLPRIDRAAIVLPAGLLDLIERQTIHFGARSARLRAAGLHLKRGLLLHGHPGTGKTLTALYLAGAMSDRTVLILTGRGLNMVARTCEMARMLQPSIVILEDVDLIAEDRVKGRPGMGNPLLFELLNEMDGLADDSDILFLLTTNRPDLLEPALASRPGRVDQAIEVPLPDDDCRRRLLELYGRGLTLRVEDLPRIIARTEGASAAFIRELVRKAALLASDDGPDIVVEDRHLAESLHELVVRGGDLTKNLLGFRARVGFDAG